MSDAPVEKAHAHRSRNWWWLATILTAAVSSAVAFRQQPRPSPDRLPGATEEFLYPVETNAWLRVPDAHARDSSDAFLDVRTTGDGSHAFAATAEGLVFRTSDGGASWQVSRIVDGKPGYRFRQFDVSSERRGWALGEDGVLYTSTDGLISWKSVREHVSLMASFPGSDDVALLDERGVGRWTPNESGEQSPLLTAVDRRVPLAVLWGPDVAAADPVPTSLLALPSGEIVLGRANVLTVVDPKKAEVVRTRHLPSDISITRLALYGEKLCARRREKSRESWVLVPESSEPENLKLNDYWWWPPDVLSAFSEASGSLWVLTGAGFPGMIWHPDGFVRLRVVLTLDEQLGAPTTGRGALWVGTSAGLLLRSTNGGDTWDAISRVQAPLPVIHMPEPGDAYAGGGGQWYWFDPEHPSFPGEANSPRGMKPRAIVLCDAKGCEAPAGTPDRTWLATNDGRVAFIDGNKVIAWALPDGDTAYGVVGYGAGKAVATGTGRNLYVTEDNGLHWRKMTYSASLAPWFYASWLLVFGMALVALRHPKAKAIGHSVSDLLVSDRPLRAASGDVTGLHEIALALSRFFRNDRTQPSVTVAITGEWGSGKSSLLNLIQQDLGRFGFSSVSFNAWHHEQEPDPIAALYGGIVAQGVPKLPSPGAIRFRLKLLWQRRSASLAWMTIWIALLAIPAGYFIFNPGSFADSLAQLTWYLDRALALIPGQAKPSGPAPQPAQWAPTLAAVFGLIGILRSFFERLSAFGVEPGAVAAKLAGKLQGGAQDRIGFHARFAEDFRRVTAALAPRRMVVCVDDLDRCSPENALKILEAINFLVSSGECFVVLAVSRGVIERDVEVTVAKSAGALAATDGKPVDTREYARRYLEKLINLEVPVPALGSTQAARLVAPNAASAEDPSTERDAVLARADRLQRASAWAEGIRQAVILGSVVALATWAGASLGRSASQWRSVEIAPPPAVTAAAPSNPSANAPSTAASTPDDGKQATAPNEPLREPSVFTQPPARRPWTFALLGAALALLVIPLVRPPSVVVNDSETFLKALRAWTGVILARHRTPRELKRFLNRLRFAAMRRRSHEAVAEDWLAAFFAGWANGFATRGRLVQRIGRGLVEAIARRSRKEPAEAPLQEDWLVALMALADEDGAAADKKPDFAALLQKSIPTDWLPDDARRAYEDLPRLETAQAEALRAAMPAPRA